MPDPIEKLNNNTFKQNKIRFKKYLNDILPVYYLLILADGIVDESETVGFIQFLQELDLTEIESKEIQRRFKNFEQMKHRPSHESVLENLGLTISEEPYVFKEYLLVHLILFGFIEHVNIDEQKYLLKVIDTLGIEDHKAEEIIEVIRKYVHDNKNKKIKFFL